MNRKRAELNFLIIIIVIFLVVSVLLMRFEINPFSYFIEKEEETKEEVAITNLNGIYIHKETTPKTYTFFAGCTISYFNNSLVIINDEYHIYRESCIGTFYIKSGKVSELKVSESLEKNKVVTLDGVDYYKNEYLDYVKVNNIVKNDPKKLSIVYPENYKILFDESMKIDGLFELRGLDFKMHGASFKFNLFITEERRLNFQLVSKDVVVYDLFVDKISDLPDLRAFGEKMVVIETLSDKNAYRYKFKSLSEAGVDYDLDSKFPIKVDTVELTTANSIFVKFNPTKNNFIMLVGTDKQLCTVDSDSSEIAYYVFDINYNYSKKKFEKPEFMEIVYKKDGCKHVNEVMGW